MKKMYVLGVKAKRPYIIIGSENGRPYMSDKIYDTLEEAEAGLKARLVEELTNEHMIFSPKDVDRIYDRIKTGKSVDMPQDEFVTAYMENMADDKIELRICDIMRVRIFRRYCICHAPYGCVSLNGVNECIQKHNKFIESQGT